MQELGLDSGYLWGAGVFVSFPSVGFYRTSALRRRSRTVAVSGGRDLTTPGTAAPPYPWTVLSFRLSSMRRPRHHERSAGRRLGILRRFAKRTLRNLNRRGQPERQRGRALFVSSQAPFGRIRPMRRRPSPSESALKLEVFDHPLGYVFVERSASVLIISVARSLLLRRRPSGVGLRA